MRASRKAAKPPRTKATPAGPVQLFMPVKPYVLKFLTKHLGANYKLTLDDIFGRQLVPLMESRRHRTRRQKGLHRYKSTFGVLVNPARFAGGKVENFTNVTIVYFNNFAEELCAGELHCLIDVCTQHAGMTIKEAIDAFRIKFGLTEEDWDEMTMRRGYLRYRRAPKPLPEKAKPAVRNYFPRKCNES